MLTVVIIYTHCIGLFYHKNKKVIKKSVNNSFFLIFRMGAHTITRLFLGYLPSITVPSLKINFIIPALTDARLLHRSVPQRFIEAPNKALCLQRFKINHNLPAFRGHHLALRLQLRHALLDFKESASCSSYCR